MRNIFVRWMYNKGFHKKLFQAERAIYTFNYQDLSNLLWEAYQLGVTFKPIHDSKIQEGEQVLLTNV